ncbi:MAG: winged helix-turn-helix transcriptional regulator [Propionibacterium sp.]|nr:winged helix-turn-helix transcriptional regulator [Propionibacterium sp.]
MAPTGAQLGDLVNRLTRILRRRTHGLPIPPHQLRALRFIAHGSVRPARLAEALGITPRAVTDVVDAMIEAGLVVATPDPGDRRAKVLEITEEGERQRAAARERRDEAAREVFDPLDDDERTELARLLEKVVGPPSC